MGLEPELALAIDPLVPTEPLIDSLRALRKVFSDLPVSFSTEGVSGAERRLRAKAASLAFVCKGWLSPRYYGGESAATMTRSTLARTWKPRLQARAPWRRRCQSKRQSLR